MIIRIVIEKTIHLYAFLMSLFNQDVRQIWLV